MTRLFSVLALIASLAACDAQTSGADRPGLATIELSPLGQSLADESAGFGTRLLAEVAAEDDGNVMLSPLSASVALTMLLNGTDGTTADQIRAVLGLDADRDIAEINEAYRSLRDQLISADPRVRLGMADAVFFDRGFDQVSPFKTTFLDALRTGYGATAEPLDFGAPATLDVINQWASDHTEGRVPKVLDEIDPDLVLILMDALYFKGDWSTQFDPDRTAPADFVRADGSTVQVPTMQGDLPGVLVHGEGYKAVELAYGRGNFTFVALMTDGPDAADTPLADLVRRLADGLWAEATNKLDAHRANGGEGEVMVHLPRFSFETDQMLNRPLQALGMLDAFRASLADLTPMNDARNLEVAFVKQNTFVAVDEVGTEAAAVTTVGVRAVSLGPHFFANRPFVFGIRERTTGALLFLGQVADPSA